jgi:hypothetical protein
LLLLVFSLFCWQRLLHLLREHFTFRHRAQYPRQLLGKEFSSLSSSLLNSLFDSLIIA